mgnify:CR=1 FL=1
MTLTGKNTSGDQGSVLTEFLIVAPLYLLLLGGLLLSNDMLRLKNKVNMVDAFVTVTGTSRFLGGEDGARAITSQVSHVWGEFMPKSITSPLMLANEYQSAGGRILANRWNAVYAGRVDVEYTMPTMISSLLSVQRVVFGDENYPEHQRTFKLFADPATGEFPSERECRFHVIQRHWTGQGGEKGFNRAADAVRLIGDGILPNVLSDAWLFTKNTLAPGTTESNDATYTQQLGKYAE